MRTLFIASTSGNSGKTMVTIGLASALREAGHRVGYFKPIGRQPTPINGRITDADAHFIKTTLGLSESLEQICPVVITPEVFTRGLRGEMEEAWPRIRQAFQAVAKDKDVLLAGGAGTLADGGFLGIPLLRLVRELEAPVLLVDALQGEVCVDTLLMAQQVLGDMLLGVILNRVAPQALPEAEQVIAPFLVGKGIEVLGILSVDPLLDAITVRQLATILDAKVVCGEAGLDEFVERFSVGAMDTEAALGYFQRLPNKAVITGGSRTDIQLAALETSTRCLILTGGRTPNQIIIARAREAGVPIVVVTDDTLATVEKVEKIRGRVRIREAQKVARAQEVLRDRLNYRRIIQKLGVK